MNSPIPISDEHGRVHDYLRISLTERCNLRCFYCMPEEGIPSREKSVFMRREEILDLSETFVSLGVRKIRLTGGEPLIRKDARQIIEGLSELPVELGVTTNGVLVDDFIETFKRVNINSLNISLDSLRSERQGLISRRNYFARIMANINLLLKIGVEVKINAVIMKGVNDDEIIDFVRWTKDIPVHVRFIEFMPFLGNNWDWKKKVSFDEIMTTLGSGYSTEQIQPLPEKPNETAKNYQIDGHKGTFGIIGAVTNPFCSSCNRIRLSADGRITNCLFSNNKIDLLTPLRNGEYVEQLIRKSIWNKKAERAGIESFEFLEPGYKNRSMVAIGG
ncbi:MAG: GTP 3',8-cyclase MoaA [Cytophagales bacterium]|nr:GTP 3',8-cyclase MoaA [Cytophagales bacterium]